MLSSLAMEDNRRPDATGQTNSTNAPPNVGCPSSEFGYPAPPLAEAPEPDVEEIARTARLYLARAGVVGVRAFGVPTDRQGRPNPAGWKYPDTLTGYYDDPDTLASDVAEIDRAGAGGVSISLHALNRLTLHRAPNGYAPAASEHRSGPGRVPTWKTVDVRRRLWFPLDLDSLVWDPDAEEWAKRPEGVNASEAEAARQLDRARQLGDALRQRFGFPAYVVGVSGNGAHALFPMDLPADDDGLTARALEGAAALAAELGIREETGTDLDTGIHDAARPLRLYGTANRKGSVDDGDRANRRSRLVSAPCDLDTMEGPAGLETVTEDALRALAALAPADEPEPANTGAPRERRGGDAYDAREVREATLAALAGPPMHAAFSALGFDLDRVSPSARSATAVLGPAALGEGRHGSFSVDFVRGLYHDHGSGGDGDSVVGGAMKARGLRFLEACAWACDAGGVAYPPELAAALEEIEARAERRGRKTRPTEPSPARPSDYTAADFMADLDLDGVAGLGLDEAEAAEEVRRRANALIPKVAVAPAAEIAEMLRRLRGTNRNSSWARDTWRKDVTQAQRQARAEAADREASAPVPLDKMKAGELEAWLAESLRAETSPDDPDAPGFARDPGGLLYRYDPDRGFYSGPCEGWVRARVLALLEENGAGGAFSTHRVDGTLYRLGTTAPELWERPPRDLLCFRNGVLDLDTCRLRPHAPGQWLSTSGLDITYDPDADPTGGPWADYFESILPDDTPAVWGFELFRYLLTPAADGQSKAVFFYGKGRDGKSTFLRLLRDVLGGERGEHVASIPLQTLTAQRFALSGLYGKALNICADLPDERLGAAPVATFKQITGGDFLWMERKHKPGFDARPYAHLVFSSNHRLKLQNSGDRAFWDRWIVVPFRGPFEPGNGWRPLDAIRAELLTPAALSALVSAALAIGDPDGRPPRPTASMVEALADMERQRDPFTPPPGPRGMDGAGFVYGEAPEPAGGEDGGSSPQEPGGEDRAASTPRSEGRRPSRPREAHREPSPTSLRGKADLHPPRGGGDRDGGEDLSSPSEFATAADVFAAAGLPDLRIPRPGGDAPADAD